MLFDFYPETIIYSLIIIIETVVTIKLYTQLKKANTKKWKYSRVWLFACMDIGCILLLIDVVLSGFPYLVYSNIDLIYFVGTYFILSGCVVCVYLTKQLSNFKHQDESLKQLYIAFVLLWLPFIVTEIAWLINSTNLTSYVKKILQAVDIFVIGIVFVFYGGVVLKQLINFQASNSKSRPDTKKINALRKISFMLIFAGIVGVGVIITNFALINSLEARVWSDFVFIVLVQILFLVILGPGIPVFGRCRKLRKNIPKDALSETFSSNSNNGNSDQSSNSSSSSSSTYTHAHSSIEIKIDASNNSESEITDKNEKGEEVKKSEGVKSDEKKNGLIGEGKIEVSVN